MQTTMTALQFMYQVKQFAVDNVHYRKYISFENNVKPSKY
jgi:hypothetical protein